MKLILFYRRIYNTLHYFFLKKVDNDNFLAILKSLALIAFSQYMLVKLILSALMRFGYLPLSKFDYIDMSIIGALFIIDFILLVDKPGNKVKYRYLLVYFILCFVAMFIGSVILNSQ